MSSEGKYAFQRNSQQSILTTRHMKGRFDPHATVQQTAFIKL